MGKLITGTSAAETLTGTTGDDTLNGITGSDKIDGGDGNDLFISSTGSQYDMVTMNGGNGDDVFMITRQGTAPTSVEIDGGAGNDVFDLDLDPGSVTYEYLTGGAGRDTYKLHYYGPYSDPRSPSIKDFSVGASGDRIDITALLDYSTANGGYSGGDFIDLGYLRFEQESTGATAVIYDYDGAAGSHYGQQVAHLSSVKATDLVAANFDFSGGRLITGTSAADKLTGGSGDDTLNGGAGSDTLTGGAGDDVYLADATGDSVVELAEGGTDRVETTAASYTLGAYVENLRYTGSAAFTGVGNALDNQIVGGDKGAKLDGAAGNDTLTGGSGADSLQGGIGNDLLIVGAGKDTADGGDGSDTLQLAKSFASYTIKRISNTDATLTDASGNVITVRNVESIDFNGDVRSTATLWGAAQSAFNDSLQGTAGSDTLDGLAGADTLSGGLGDDIYVVDNVADVVVEADGQGTDLVKVALTAAGTYILPDNVEYVAVTAAASIAVNVTGNALDNLIVGNAAANVLVGGAGNDTLDGGAGADKLNGGLGNDVYQVGESGDVVTENLNEGTDTVRTTLASYTLGANVENLLYTGSAAFTGIGNLLDNTIIGGDKNNKIDGGAGNDSLTGGLGNDSLIGGLGNDSFSATAGKDTIEGGDGADVLQGLGKFSDYGLNRPNATDTVLTDKAGNQITVRGVESFVFSDASKSLSDLQFNVASVSNDSLTGSDKADTIDGGLGVDTLAGGKGDDTYVVDNAADVVQELSGGGKDLVQVAFTAAGTYTLGDYVENATVTAAASLAVNLAGNDLDNALTGNAAANSLAGGAGNDTLDGGAGADKLAGGVGDDVYFVDNAGDGITENLWEGRDTVNTTLASYTLGANLEELRYTGAAAFTGVGNADDNVIVGGNNGNKLDGGAGWDSLTGGAGADSLAGGAGNDTLVGTAGKDTVDGGADEDMLKLSGKFADYTISRASATDTVLTDKAGNVVTVRNVEVFRFSDGDKSLEQVQYNVASAFNDTLSGGNGNDLLNGLAGADTMMGGLGNDTYVIDNLGDVVQESDDYLNGGADTLQIALTQGGTYTMPALVENATVTAGASVAVNVIGNGWDNQITGNAAANTLSGDWGNDTLDGGAGNDKLIGGGGDDVYLVGEAGDTVTELLDEGYDIVRASVASYTLGANVERLDYMGAAVFTGTGNLLDNVIRGGNGGAKLDGGAGNDTLVGGSGNDSLQGGLGDDSLQAGSGKDTVDGGAGYDVLAISGKQADYTVTRPSISDTVLTDKAGNVLTVRNVEVFSFSDGDHSPSEVQLNSVSAYDDVLTGTDNNDSINGLAGADTMMGGLGNDTYVVDNLGDVVEESSDDWNGGNDSVQLALTAAGTYTLAAFVENATVTAAAAVAVNVNGNDWDNQITGNAAANTLSGGWGNDTLDGGAGNDKLIGGDGDDVYVVSDSGDVVTELEEQGTDLVRATVASYTLAANVEQLEYIGTAAFTGTGNALDNLIRGGNGGAKLDGGAGNDTVVGGSGNDSLQGGLGDDTLQAGTGKDTIDGGAGEDTLQLKGGAGDYTITHPTATDVLLTDKAGNVLTVHTNVEWLAFADATYALSDLLVGIASPGSDLMLGTTGKDTLDGLAGADTLRGDDGDDTYIIDNVGDLIEEAPGAGTDTAKVGLAAAVTYQLADGVENAIVTSAAAVSLSGNGLDNALTGNSAANTLAGGDGNDTLDGAGGSDKLLGGSGDDLYLLGDADLVTELADAGYDTVKTTLASYTLADNVEALVYAGSGAFSGTGNAQANTLTGGNGGNKLDGGAGDDELTGGSGNDSLLGGAGDDTLGGHGGNDTLDGGAGQDQAVLDWVARDQVTVVRTSATDTLITDHDGNAVTLRNIESVVFSDSTAGIEDLQYNVASPGNDHLVGTDGNDLLNGGAGIDILEGYGGNDTYVIADKASVVVETESAGTDTVQVALTSAATYTLADNVENAVVTAAASVAVNLTGNGLNNQLTGNTAANVLTGGLGDDTLDGGAGADKLIGGEGDDVYIINDAGDTITELAGQGSDIVKTSLSSYTLGANVETVLYTGSGAFSATGNADGNLMGGGHYGAKLDGGAGNDFLLAGNGNDSLQGGLGNDIIFAGYGKDTVDGGAGADTLDGLDDYGYYSFERLNATDLKISRGLGGDSIVVRNVELFNFNGVTQTLQQLLDNSVGSGSDTVWGSVGDDVLDGGAGDDVLIGRAGNDIYILSSPGDQVFEFAGYGVDGVLLQFSSAATYTLADEVEYAVVSTDNTLAVNVVGNDLDNYLLGNGGANTLSGGIGDDRLDGGAGNDVLAGGVGDDQYAVGESGDVIKENANEGHDIVFVTAAAYKLSANVEDMVFEGTGAFSGTGNDGSNRLFSGSASGAKLDGGAGNDLLVGNVNNDSLLGGAGDDSFQASAGNDTIDGGAGADVYYNLGARSDYAVSRLNATDVVLTDRDGNMHTVRGVETFYFGAEKLTLAQVQANTFGATNDSVGGTSGNDMLDGGAGADTMTGGDGDDTYVIDNLGDRVVEVDGGGLDQIKLNLASGTYVMDNGVEDAQVIAPSAAVNVTGNALANTIIGNAAANKLLGGAGTDTLDGGDGNDTLSGGSDADTFVLSSLAGSKTITDFVSGTDSIRLAMDVDWGGGGTAVKSGQGGFSGFDMLVLCTQKMATASSANAAAVIGSADWAYEAGDKSLFAVSTATDTTIYLFVSKGNDALVSADELTALVTLTGTPSTTLEDYLFL